MKDFYSKLECCVWKTKSKFNRTFRRWIWLITQNGRNLQCCVETTDQIDWSETSFEVQAKHNGPNCYKTKWGTDKVNGHSLSPKVGEPKSRGHRLKWKGKYLKGTPRISFSTKSVVVTWNKHQRKWQRWVQLQSLKDFWTGTWMGSVKWDIQHGTVQHKSRPFGPQCL